MAGIAGIMKKGQHQVVSLMLDTMSHRGNHGKEILEFADATIGITWLSHEDTVVTENLKNKIFMDGPGYGHYLKVILLNGSWVLFRDELGVAPMYYAKTPGDNLCFASEVKALLIVSNDVNELQPGHFLNDNTTGEYFHLEKKKTSEKKDIILAEELHELLSLSVKRRITSDTFGSWLSGGLDSSTIAVLAKPWVKTLHTFSGGLKNAPDIEYARIVAKHIGSRHHEVIITLEDIENTLPELIYHLESFDALLVRSSIVNFLVSKAASGYVGEVFSGEGGDELFAGYNYLKNLPEENLDDELIDIIGRLHNTALQRVDRSANAHGTTAHTIFTDSEVVDFALSIPVKMKLRNGIEKWILRKAMQGHLPESILSRTKSKFWEGAGIGEIISDYAFQQVSDKDFLSQRKLKNGWVLNSKEEFLYYRMFREAFGELKNLDWMGRTKGAPKS